MEKERRGSGERSETNVGLTGHTKPYSILFLFAIDKSGETENK